MKKYVLDLDVASVTHINDKYVLIKLTRQEPLPDMLPGQFVEVRVDDSPSTFLRRPISINFVDREANQLWLLVAAIGDGTRRLSRLEAGDKLNVMLPLGNSFTMPSRRGRLSELPACWRWRWRGAAIVYGQAVGCNGLPPHLSAWGAHRGRPAHALRV